MTLTAILSSFDSYRPNTLPEGLKLHWINTLEATIFNDVISQRLKDGGVFTPFTPADGDRELSIPHPYTDVYLHYLALQTDLYYGDVARYNNDLMLYTSAFSGYAKRVNKLAPPIKTTAYFNA